MNVRPLCPPKPGTASEQRTFRSARRAESEAMRRCAPETDVFVLGDCAAPATVFEAVNDAFRACLHV